MARSRITDQTIQLNNDSGAVLWSLIQGEQREFPITISSLVNLSGYTIEAVTIEADNTTNGIPKAVKAGGITTTLDTRVPVYKGEWSAAVEYNYDDFVEVSGSGYLRTKETPSTGDLVTDESVWTPHTNNVIYLRFPETFGNDWLPQPTPMKSVYGFFELRITEPSSLVAYVQTYKPVRGLVESLFSPTDL